MLLLVAKTSAYSLGSAFRAAPLRTTRAAAFSMSDTEFDSVKPATVVMFPGQGAQVVGMGAAAAAEPPAAAELYAKAKDILGYDLLAIDDKAQLDKTDVSQPAIFVASMAAVEKLRAEDPAALEAANMAMGLSLGEYTALAFAGAISFEDGVKITKARGEAMQAASEASSSGMASVIGLDKEKVAELCAAAAEATGKPIGIANFLCPGNYAVSGAMEAVEKVMEIAKPDFGARMAVKLAVAGAFHTDFMAPAVGTLEEVLVDGRGLEAADPRRVERRREGALRPGGDQGHPHQAGDGAGAVGDDHDRPQRRGLRGGLRARPRQGALGHHEARRQEGAGDHECRGVKMI